MKKYFALLSVLAVFQSAQSAEPVTPAVFVAKASEAGMAEIELGKLAAQKGNSAEVKQYGQRMVADHGKADAELKPIADAKKLPTTKALSPAHQKALETLNQKAGADFDAAYAQQMVKDHNDAVALFTAGAALPDQELSAFASKTLPTLKEHQQQAGKLHGMH